MRAEVLEERAMLARKKKFPKELRGRRKSDFSFAMEVCGQNTNTPLRVGVWLLPSEDAVVLFSPSMFERDVGVSQQALDALEKEMVAEGSPPLVARQLTRPHNLDLQKAVDAIGAARSEEFAKSRSIKHFCYPDAWGPVIEKRPCFIRVVGLFSAARESDPTAGRGIMQRLSFNTGWRQEIVVGMYNSLTELSRAYTFFYPLARWPDTDLESATYMRLCEVVVDKVVEANRASEKKERWHEQEISV